MEIKPLVIGDLKARIPVIQGGMGVGISLSNLAGAVAAAGGVGVISAAQVGFREAAFEQNPLAANLKVLKQEILKAKKTALGGLIGVNIMMATRYYEEYVKTAVTAGVDLIITGAGLPVALPELVGNARTKIAPIVSTVKSAAVICKMWDRKYKRVPDLVVIEGPRAGGHLGFTLEQIESFQTDRYDREIEEIIALVKTYSDKYTREIPVVVAGGIYHRADMEKYLQMGAAGVQMGTRFVTTYECDAPMEYKQAYLDAKKEAIEVIKSPVGMPGRAISNLFLEQVKTKKPRIEKCYQCLARCNPAEIPYCITKALVDAASGRTEEGLLFCGDNAWKAEKLESTADILKEFS